MHPRDGLYKKLINSAPYGTLFFLHDVCLECSPSAERILGCHREKLIGSSVDRIQGDESPGWLDLKRLLRDKREPGHAMIHGTLRRDADCPVAVDVILHRPDEAGCELVVTLLERDSGMPQHRLPPEAYEHSVHRAASAVGVQSEPGVYLPHHALTPRDSLTGLPTRQYLIDQLGGYLEVWREARPCGALLLIDLDNFKDINDSWGFGVGDQVIRKLGAAIARVVVPEHLLVRLSGDEFALFIPNIPGGASRVGLEAREQAEKLREIIAVPLFHDGHELAITASIGIALITDSVMTAERALQYADSAMYEAKRNGRNGIAFFESHISEKARRQIGLNTRLRRAIDHQEFALHIQPQLCVATNRLVGGEVLLRWVSLDSEFSAPADFIPVLEASGLIVNVGHWVIRTACEYLRSYLDAGLWQEHMRLSINISPRQFLDPQLLEVLGHSLSSYRIQAHYLNFEITESLLLHDTDDVVRKMRRIKSLGAQFSIDDFGIGYSSMAYLKRLPFDHLKIDREFIQNIHRDPECRGVVEAIMTVSRQYGLHVTAEGVERPESLQVLRQVGCDSYQGAYYSMPVHPDRFRTMLMAS